MKTMTLIGAAMLAAMLAGPAAAEDEHASKGDADKHCAMMMDHASGGGDMAAMMKEMDGMMSDMQAMRDRMMAMRQHMATMGGMKDKSSPGSKPDEHPH